MTEWNESKGSTDAESCLFLTGLLPEVNVFQVAHSDQSAQIQTLHSVPSHSQLVNYTQSLQHSRDVREAVKGKPQAVELKQATHLIRQGAEVVSIQRQRLQAKRKKGTKQSFAFFYFRERTKYLLTTICICSHYLLHSDLGNAA